MESSAKMVTNFPVVAKPKPYCIGCCVKLWAKRTAQRMSLTLSERQDLHQTNSCFNFSIYPSIRLSVLLSICPSICPSVSPKVIERLMCQEEQERNLGLDKGNSSRKQNHVLPWRLGEHRCHRNVEAPRRHECCPAVAKSSRRG